MNVTDEMVEAAARAWWNGIVPNRSWSSAGIEAQTTYRRLALASLEAAFAVQAGA